MASESLPCLHHPHSQSLPWGIDIILGPTSKAREKEVGQRMSAMAVSSGAAGRSSLNPNAPLFVPMAFRQVEDFSPEWYELVKTTPWFREHWFRQQQEQETFGYDDEDVVSMLPDSFDLGITDEFSISDTEFDEAAAYYQAFEAEQQLAGDLKKFQNGLGNDVKALVRSLSSKSPRNGATKIAFEPAKHWEKPLQSVSPKFSPRRIIQQPR